MTQHENQRNKNQKGSCNRKAEEYKDRDQVNGTTTEVNKSDRDAHGPNETELSHRWRRRAWQKSRTVSQNQTWTSQRPAVGSSDWLGLLCCIGQKRLGTERASTRIYVRTASVENRFSAMWTNQAVTDCAMPSNPSNKRERHEDCHCANHPNE